MHVYILLDQSGSMLTNWDETLGAVNGYVSDLAKDSATKTARTTIITFDKSGDMRFDIVRRNVAPAEYQKITSAEVEPRGMTPLYDAVGRLQTLVTDDNPERALIAIMTDGMENASVEITSDAAKSVVKNFESKGFDVVFLGADFDAMNQAMDIGISGTQTLNTIRGSYSAAMGSLSARTSFYASTGQAGIGWSDEDRDRAMGKSDT